MFCNVSDLLFTADVRETPQTKAAKQCDVEEIIKRWIRTAFDRDGVRSKVLCEIDVVDNVNNQ